MAWVLPRLSNAYTGLLDTLCAVFSGRRGRPRLIALIACLIVLILWEATLPSSDAQRHTSGLALSGAALSHLPCWSLPGAGDTLAVIRTGSTEFEDRFPVHLQTSLRCFPHYLLFSDLQEDYHGQHILDALDSVSPEIRVNHKDFELYRRLQSNGRKALDPSELSGGPEAFARLSGNAENPGWKLDKWKFMPMVNRTIHEYPKMKWYVFTEADTFLLWSMLQQYLALLDHTKPYYAGHQMFAGSELFAHGGAGFVVSQPAMRKLADYYAAHKAEIEAFTDGHWAGDCVLGKYLQEAGVPFTNAFPHFQGDFPGLVAYAGPDERSGLAKQIRERCYPTISYHHMSPDMIINLWQFEQQWISEHDAQSETLRHWDIFKQFVMPQMVGPKLDWDNLSDQEESGVSTIEQCHARCEEQPECRQYSFTQDTRFCKTRVDPRLGKPSNGTQSDWFQDRILRFEKEIAPCGVEGWQV